MSVKHNISRLPRPGLVLRRLVPRYRCISPKKSLQVGGLPVPLAPIVSMAEENTPSGINPNWGSAEDTSAPSYLSSSNLAWTNVATVDQLDNLSEQGRAMLKKVEASIQAVTEDYQKRMSQQEEVVTTLYNQLLEAIVSAEKATINTQTLSTVCKSPTGVHGPTDGRAGLEHTYRRNSRTKERFLVNSNNKAS